MSVEQSPLLLLKAWKLDLRMDRQATKSDFEVAQTPESGKPKLLMQKKQVIKSKSVQAVMLYGEKKLMILKVTKDVGVLVK